MKSINTLIPDIYRLFEEDHKVSEENSLKLGHDLGQMIERRMNENKEYKPSLRMSNLGTKCWRQLWYKINKPELGEKLQPWTRIKFLFGDILELLLLYLAKEAGHEVRGEQDELEIEGVIGHRDGVIDGVLVDAKSASTFSFQSFRNHLELESDKFGYIDQLGAYHWASDDVDKDIAAFLVIDKQHGHITLDKHKKNDVDYKEKVDELKEMLAQPEPPERAYSDEPFQKSGNRKLCTNCSYCAFKRECWPDLRTFLYSNKPEYLTHVEKEPRVTEIIDG
jgi:hypothetical protein